MSAYRRIAERRNLQLDERELEVLAGVADQLLEDCEVLDRLPDVRPPVRHGDRRDGGRPAAEDNPYHGWVRRCHVEGAPDGPLAGRTVGLKDTVALAGIPLLNGSEVLEGFVPSEDATIVTRLLDAGATIVGKTAVPAFCFEGAGLIGYPQPLPDNPADPARLPGGSSSGSAALVAGGAVDLAIGGDQGGSIRIPAAWCGCVGHKPTFGLVPYTGCFPVEYTFDAVGPMAATVADCAAMLDAIAGPDGLDPRQPDVPARPTVPRLGGGVEGVRIGVLDEGFGGEPEVDAAVRATADALRAAGAVVGSVSVPMHRDAPAIWSLVCLHGGVALLLDGAGVGTNTGGHLWTELADFLHRALPRMAGSLPETVKATILAADLLHERRGLHYYAKARNLVPVLGAAYDAALSEHDVLLMPTVPFRAPLRDKGDSAEERILTAIGLASSANVAGFNLTGHPSLSVPCQADGELPVGALVTGRRFDDGLVMAVGEAIERSG